MTETQKHFSELSINITNNLTKIEKKTYGIYITPNSIINRLHKNIVTILGDKINNVKNILEPSCGTCEIINFCDSYYTNINIDGIEFNDKIYNSIKGLIFKNNVNIIKYNFIYYKPDKLYDIIIGNPPYFVCKKTDVPEEYEKYILGRPNIFGIFILHSLKLLKEGGLLALIIPKSFLNSLYYSKIRNYIKDTCTILSIDDYKDLNDFIDTEQSTFGLILMKNAVKKEVTECNYSVLLNNNYIFTDNSLKLKELFDGSTTLKNMGFKVRTGQIVWNEHKDKLTDDENETLLIYNSNISKDNKFELKNFKNDEKKQYINFDGRIEPVLVVNRGNGNSTYNLNYSIIDKGPFLIENHLNEIYYPKKIERKELLKIYEKIILSFNNKKTQEFINLFLGNNGLSKTELESIFPIYDI
jgi:hypothetical protein